MKKMIVTLLVLGAILGGLVAMPVAVADDGCTPIALPLPDLGLGSDDCPKPPVEDYPQWLSGCAYGAFADVTHPVTGLNAVLNNVAPVNFTNAGGAPAAPALSAPCPMWGPVIPAITNFVASASLPVGTSPVGVDSRTIFTSTEAEPFNWWFPSGYSLSSAQTERVSITIPAAGLSITADAVRAVAYCTKVAGPLGRNDVGPAGYGEATLVNLSITKTTAPAFAITIPVLPAEDTWIPIPGVGGVMLRETWDLESPPYPGNPYKSFTENMIHVYLTNPLLVTGDVIVSQAHCDGYGLSGQPNSQPGGHGISF